jgi:hypothetical protein
MTPLELDHNEKQCFLEWRKTLATYVHAHHHLRLPFAAFGVGVGVDDWVFFFIRSCRLEQQEDLVLTPFEKNLEVWRQLWRVVERSNVIVQVPLQQLQLQLFIRTKCRLAKRANVQTPDYAQQIVDARNPMVMCTDLDKYVQEVDPAKKSLLLVNKADLLTTKQR